MIKQIVSIEQATVERDDLPISYVGSSYTIAQVFMKEIGSLTQENLVLICLGTKNQVNSYSIVHVGSLNFSVAHPRDIFQRVFLSNAARIILLHNHPSNNTKPSQNDIDFTDRINRVCEIMGIDFLDHIIVGSDNYYSFKEENLILKVG